jgi:hypothetical protein
LDALLSIYKLLEDCVQRKSFYKCISAVSARAQREGVFMDNRYTRSMALAKKSSIESIMPPIFTNTVGRYKHYNWTRV